MTGRHTRGAVPTRGGLSPKVQTTPPLLSPFPWPETLPWPVCEASPTRNLFVMPVEEAPPSAPPLPRQPHPLHWGAQSSSPTATKGRVLSGLLKSRDKMEGSGANWTLVKHGIAARTKGFPPHPHPMLALACLPGSLGTAAGSREEQPTGFLPESFPVSLLPSMKPPLLPLLSGRGKLGFWGGPGPASLACFS